MNNTQNIPLHVQRWEEAKRKAINDAFVRANEAAKITTDSTKNNLFGIGANTKGKDVKFKPLVYYNANDAIANCMKEFKQQAAKNIDIIKTSRETKGQRLAVKADLKDVLGEFHEGKRNVMLSQASSVTFYTYIKEFCGYLCYFEVTESYYGAGSMKRRGYLVEKVSVIYYQKNGVGLSKEVILKVPFWTNPKHPAKNKKEDK